MDLDAGGSDLSVLLLQVFGGAALSVPFGAFIAAAQGADAATRLRRRLRLRERRRAPDAAWPQAPGQGFTEGARPAVPPRRAWDDVYLAHLRRAAPVVRLFVAGATEGEREAAYRALVRLAARADATSREVLGGFPVTPGTLYRDVTRGASRLLGASAPAFDAQVCAELDSRDASRRAASHEGWPADTLALRPGLPS